MSKFVLSLIAAVAIASPALAQHKVGAVLGYNIGMGSADIPNLAFKGAGGFKVGGNYSYWFNKEWAIRSGLVYTQRDFALEGTGPNSGAKVKYALSHIDLPLNAQYAFGDSGFSLFGGFKLGLGSGKSCTIEPASAGTCGTSNDIKGGANFINVGGEYEFTDVGSGKLGAFLEYDHGLDNINNATGTNSAYKVMVSGLALGLVWNFDL